MARTVKEQDYAVKRNEILDAAQRLMYTSGYEQVSIQDILDELRISKGAFYHYFGSKHAVLEALIERTRQQGQQILSSILEDPNLPALTKLQRFFDTMGRWKTAQKDYLLVLVKIWYADKNALLRQKTIAATLDYATPLITQAIRQGVDEGVLTTRFPDDAGAIVLNLLVGIGDMFVPLLFSNEPSEALVQRAERIVAAYNDALERVLGAPAGSLHLMDFETLRAWFDVSVGQATADLMAAR